MGIMDWLRPKGDGEGDAEPAAPAGGAARGSEVGGLDFKSAVDAHMKWKVRLDVYINGTSDEQLKVETVCRDDQCPLGKWIYSRGNAEFGYSETFFDMKTHHANFHRCAGDVLAAAQAGRKDEALRLLHQGDYVRASERVKKLLARLFVLVADGQTAIDAHVKWKERLHDYIAGKSAEELKIEEVARDDRCVLGAWLAGEGARHYGSRPGFDALRRAHARFHEMAGKVLAVAQAGDRTRAVGMLDEGDYAAASDAVTAALVDFFSGDMRRQAS